MSRIRYLLILACVVYAAPALGGWKVLDARWRPDSNPWAKEQVWDGYIWSEGWSEQKQFYPKYFEPAGSVHVILRNESERSDTAALTHIDGVPVEDLITTPERAAPVIWHRVEAPRLIAPQTGVNREDEAFSRVEPAEVEAGKWAECSIRFRSTPAEAVRLRFRLGSAGHLEVPVAVSSPRVRLESISFSPRTDRLFIYMRSLDGKRIKKGTVRLDGRDANASCRWTEGPEPRDLMLAEVKLDPPWEYGSHHLIEVDLPGGECVVQPVRAWDGFFTIGMYGVVEPERVRDAKAHGINTYFTAGVSPVLDEAGLNCVPTHNVGEGRVRTPEQSGVLFYQNYDEPDAHDFGLGEELPVMERLGVYAQSRVLPIIRYQRARDPRTPNLVLVNNTYKPLHWYVYGQIPDIYCTDPYVPLNGRQLDYVPRALEAARDACTPRPLVSILWATGLSSERIRLGDRPPLPEEERMMVFYALGAGVKGIAYFIDMTATTGEGKFIGLSDNKPLWEEVGRTNRDVAALASYLSVGCPLTPPRQQDKVWWRALLCGADHVVVIVVDTDHHIGFETRTTYAWHTPASNVKLAVPLPAHFRGCRVQEIKDGEFVPFAGELTKEGLRLELDSVDTARAFLISAGAR